MNRLARLAALILITVVAGCSNTTVTPSPDALSTGQPTVFATDPPSPSPTASATSESRVAADLDGMLSDPSVAHRLPVAVSIDDAAAARPQSGFNAASIVWHAPADGYEVRYVLMFQELDATDIGPVRSTRIYIAQWTAEVAGALAHYGGDRLTLTWLKSAEAKPITNVDGLGKGRPAFHRISSRKAPHNAYTNTADLRRTVDGLGGPATISSTVHLRPFRDDSLVAEHGTSQTITIPFRTVSVKYTYDPIANAYNRSLNGVAHIDPMDGRQVTARTVAVLEMPFHTDNKIEPGHNRPVLGFIGHGTARVFMEGRLITGTWSKAGPLDPTLILGPDGKELPLVRGRIFIEVVPSGTKVAIAT